MLCPCPADQVFLKRQQGDKVHPAPGVEGKACVEMASKTDGMTQKVGLGVQGHTAGGNTQRRGPSCGSVLGAAELELSCQGGAKSIHLSLPWAN